MDKADVGILISATGLMVSLGLGVIAAGLLAAFLAGFMLGRRRVP